MEREHPQFAGFQCKKLSTRPDTVFLNSSDISKGLLSSNGVDMGTWRVAKIQEEDHDDLALCFLRGSASRP